MAVPARDNRAAAQEPPDTANKHDPRARGWADVRFGLITAVEAWVLAVQELVQRPGDAAALAMVEMTGRPVEALGEIARRWVLDEHVLADVERRAYDAGYAAAKAERCRLASVPDAG